MKNKGLVYILFLALLILIVFIIKNYYSKVTKDEFIPTKQRIIRLETTGKTQDVLFFKVKNWGVAGNHEEIALSKDTLYKVDKSRDYIFYTSEVYYKLESNKLVLRAPESSISEPTVNSFKTSIILNPLHTSDEISLFDKEYKKLGFQRISIYDK